MRFSGEDSEGYTEIEDEGASGQQPLDALRSSEERYRRLLASVTDYVYTVTVVDNRPVETSHGPACVAVTGYTAEEYANDPLLWHRMVHDDDKKAVTAQADDLLAGRTPTPLEHRLVHRNGSLRWVRNTPVPRHDQNGHLVGYDGLIADISERKLAEEALRESEEKYRKLVEAAKDAIFLETLSGRVLDCNSAACQIYGYTRDELLSMDVADLVPENVRNALEKIVDEHLVTGSIELDTENLRKGGELFPCEVSTQVVTVHGETRVIAFVRDISERRQKEQEIRRLADELTARNQALVTTNQELESFCYSVSHDLRTPLLLADSFSRLLVEEHKTQLTPEAARLLSLVQQNVERMGHLIDDLLAFSRCSFQPMTTREVDIAALAREAVLELLAPEGSRHIDVRVDPLPHCLGDPALLKQVLVNLIGNALKFTRDREDASIEVGSSKHETGTVYHVSDNGVGFNVNQARELFGVFRRFHRSDLYEGSGVGLAIVQRIVKRHGGRVWAEAEPNRGATFFFTLGQAE